MNTMALPKNAKLAYDAAIEMMSSKTDIDDVSLGAEFYDRFREAENRPRVSRKISSAFMEQTRSTTSSATGKFR